MIGKLKYAIKTSFDNIEAGKEFSIFVNITNLYDVPVKIESVSTKLPIEFINVEQEKIVNQTQVIEEKIKQVFKQRIPKLNNDIKKKQSLNKELIRNVLRIMPFGSTLNAGVMLTEYITASQMSVAKTINDSIDELKTDEVEQLINSIGDDIDTEEEIQKRLIKYLKDKINSLNSNLQKEIILQPGNSTVQMFTLRTKGKILFSPSLYNLNIEIQYEINDIINQDVIDYSFMISSSLNSMILGSVIGSSLGYIVKDIFNDRLLFEIIRNCTPDKCLLYLSVLMANIIVSIFIVVNFSRKKGIQKVITIEDFWGGLLLGFISGYLGKSYFEKFLR